MKPNEFEQKLMRYLDGELSAPELEGFEEELHQAGYSKDNLEEFTNLHIALQQHPQPEPPKGLLKQYHTSLQKRFAPESRWDSFMRFVSSVADMLVWERSPWFRFAEVAVFIVVGIFIGNLFFTPGAQKIIVQPASPGMNDRGVINFIQPISQVDRERLQRYFLESEILLLQIVNSSDPEAIDPAEFEFSKEIAENLLLKTAITQEKAIQLNNVYALRFVSRMEILLHEIANLSEEELYDALPIMQQIISDTNLLMEVKTLQEMLKNSKTADIVS